MWCDDVFSLVILLLLFLLSLLSLLSFFVDVNEDLGKLLRACSIDHLQEDDFYFSYAQHNAPTSKHRKVKTRTKRRISARRHPRRVF